MSAAAAPLERRERVVRVALALLGAMSLGLGLWMVVSPSSFFDVIGPFGERNDHYIRDMATWQAAAGIGLLVAAGRASWRRPMIAIAGIQAAVHAVNHLVDAGKADPGWVGIFDVVTVAGTAALFAWLWTATSEVR